MKSPALTKQKAAISQGLRDVISMCHESETCASFVSEHIDYLVEAGLFSGVCTRIRVECEQLLQRLGPEE